MKKRFAALFLTVILLILCVPAMTAADYPTYYIDRVNGDDTNNGSETAPFKTVQKALTTGGTDTFIIRLAADYADAGNAYTIYPYQDVTFDLNGHSYTNPCNTTVFTVQAQGFLTIDDQTSEQKGKFTATNGRIVYVEATAGFVIRGGTLSGTTAKHSSEAPGGAVYNDGSFNMFGGTLKDCSTNTKGGAVYNYGLFTMSGGTIEGCKASVGGGAIYNEPNGYVYLAGDVIKNCSVSTGNKGGAVYNDGGYLELQSSIVLTGNYATGGGAAVYMYGGEMKVKGSADVTYNESTSKGAVMLDGRATFSFGGKAQITGNGAANLYITDGCTVKPDDTSAPQSGMKIGVTMEKTNEITTIHGFAENDCSSYFTSDDDGYTVQDSSTGISGHRSVLVKSGYTVEKYVEIDHTEYENIDLLYYIPSASTNYEWEITHSDLEKEITSRASFLGIYNGSTDRRSGYFFSERNQSSPYFQMCAGTNYQGTKYYLFGKGKNTIHAKYTPGTYSFYDSLGLVGSESSPDTGTWSGTYAYGSSNIFKAVRCSGGEYLSMKLYDLRIWEEGVLKSDCIAATRKNGSVTEEGLYDLTAGKFLPRYSDGVELTFDPQGAATPGTESAKVLNGYSMPTITTPVNGTDVFMGYYTGKNGQGTKYYNANGTPTKKCDLTADTTLYAYWAHAVCYTDGERSNGYVIDGKTYYDNLKAAITNASYKDLITLIDDATGDIKIDTACVIRIDLNGHMVTGSSYGFQIEKDAELYLLDSGTKAYNHYEVTSAGYWKWAGNEDGHDEPEDLNTRPETGDLISMTGGGITTNGAGRGILVYGYLELQGGNIVGNGPGYGSGVNVNGGKFVMTGGRIIGNNAGLGSNRDSGGNGGGGVALDNDAIFNMSGGSVSFNNARYGGGVRLGKNGVFNMSGDAEIAFNLSQGNGPAIQMDGTAPQVNMTGGTIHDNTVENPGSGGEYDHGVLVYTGTFNMTGGEISGNNGTATNPKGAITVMNKGSVTLGGSAKIIDDESGVNLYVSSGKTVSISTASAPNGMKVGVTMQTPPDDFSTFAAFTGENAADYTASFTSDNEDYSVYNETKNVLGLFLHVHDWAYSVASGTTDTAEAVCVNTQGTHTYDGTDLRVTILAETATYDGKAHGASFSGTTIAGLDASDMPEILYRTYNGSSWGNPSDSVPTEPGQYKAEATFGSATIYKEFLIVPKPSVVTVTPEANTLTYAADYLELVTEGTAENGTMEYALGSDGTTAPTSGWSEDIPLGINAGTYYVWYKSVGNAPRYADSEPVCVTVTVNKAPLTIESATIADKIYDGTTSATVTDLVISGTLPGETLTAGTDYTYGGVYDKPGSESSSDPATKVTVTVTLLDTALANNYQMAGTKDFNKTILDSDLPGTPVVTPATVTVEVGETAEYTVTVDAEYPTYQWYVDKNNGSGFTAISGATGTSYTTDAADLSFEGYKYLCEVTDIYKRSGRSNVAELHVNGALPDTPVVTPDSVIVAPWDTATFTCTAAGTNLTYQWFEDSNDGRGFVKVYGATSFVYQTAALTIPCDGYKYLCEVTDEYGRSARSNEAKITVNKYLPYEPVVTPATVTVDPGETAEYTVSCEGEDLLYQWYIDKNDGSGFVAITGANGEKYVTDPAELSFEGYKYYCEVSDIYGFSGDSNEAELHVNGALPETPVVTPATVTIEPGETAEFTVKTAAEDPEYQWYVDKNDGNGPVAIPGATAEKYTTDPADLDFEGYRYSCKITDKYGRSGFSTEAELHVNGELPYDPVVTPRSIAVEEGKSVTFSVDPVKKPMGNGPMSLLANGLSYQWYVDKNDGKGMVPISGANGSKYTTGPTKLIENGYQFLCKVSDAFGRSALSNRVTLYVYKGPAPVPPTGDNDHPLFWCALCLMSIAAAAGVRRKDHLRDL